MQYKTNHLNENALFSQENYKNIVKDFWLYEFYIDPKEVGYEYSLIDELKQDLPNTMAVVYLKEKAFYALFSKNSIKKFELDEKIDSLIKNKITCKYISNLEEISKRYLAQILFNSLANTSSKNSNFSNITGALYWIVKSEGKKNKWQYVALKIELDKYLNIKLEVNTFTNLKMAKKINFSSRKKKLKEHTQYEILSDNIRSMRRLKSSEANKNINNIYILAQLDSQRNKVPFLDISNWENFSTSKSGVLYQFLKDVKEYLGEYINIEFVSLPFKEKLARDKNVSKEIEDKIKLFYRNREIVINIADSLKTEEPAIKMAETIKAFLTDKKRDYKSDNVSIGKLSKNAINIRIIHNKQFYIENKFEDEYFKDDKYLIHHVTVEDFDIMMEKKGKFLDSLPAIDVVLKETYIKNDIKEGKITILDWCFGEWFFMGIEEIKDDNKSKKDKKFNYHLLKISEDGSLHYSLCLDHESFKEKTYQEYKTIYNTYRKYNSGFINCLLVANNDNVNIIYETPCFTIQEIEEIGHILELEEKDRVLDSSYIINLIDSFLKVDSTNNQKDIQGLQKLKSLLDKKDKISKQDLITMFDKNYANLGNRGKNHLQSRFCKFYQEKTNDVLKSFFRGKESKDQLLSSKLDIFYQENDSQTEAYYFVGDISEGINSCFQNATNIRKVKAAQNLQGKQSKLIFEQLLPTLCVEFVKQRALTVIPFPFKYLREIVK